MLVRLHLFLNLQLRISLYMKLRSYRLVAVFIFLYSFKVWSAIDVVPKVLELTGDSDRIAIINNGEKTEFINIKLKKITNPGIDYSFEDYIDIKEDDDPKIYYSPFRIALSPKQKKYLTVKRVKEVLFEEVYRIDIMPSLLPVSNGNDSAVIINIGFSSIIRNYPKVIRKEFEFNCGNTQDVAINKGNTHITARYISGDLKGEAINIYPGQKKYFPHKDVVVENQTCRL